MTLGCAVARGRAASGCGSQGRGAGFCAFRGRLVVGWSAVGLALDVVTLCALVSVDKDVIDVCHGACEQKVQWIILNRVCPSLSSKRHASFFKA